MIDRQSIERWLAVRMYGWYTSSFFRPDTEPARMRARFERWASATRRELQHKYPRLRFEDHRVGALDIESLSAVPSPRCVILHLHGGAFVFGSIPSYRQRALRFSFRCDAEVFVPAYRLAPEHPFPAALDDALVAYQYVRASRPELPIIVTGDSAGGGLALSLLVRLRERRQRLPAGAIMLSPWLDLSTSRRTARGDRWLTPAHLARWSAYYLGEAARDNPEISPVLADLAGLPPLLLLAGEQEILLDDAQRAATVAQRCGTSARVIVGKGMQHDWPLTLPQLAESKQAWRQMRAFVDASLEEQVRKVQAPKEGVL